MPAPVRGHVDAPGTAHRFKPSGVDPIAPRRPIIEPSAPCGVFEARAIAEASQEPFPMTTLERIHLADLWPSSVEPVRLYASFDGVGDMLTAQAPDLELEWMRYQDESAEKFSRRIANDLLQARGRPPLPPIAARRAIASQRAACAGLTRRHTGAAWARRQARQSRHSAAAACAATQATRRASQAKSEGRRRMKSPCYLSVT